jgi:hypothetical protein
MSSMPPQLPTVQALVVQNLETTKATLQQQLTSVQPQSATAQAINARINTATYFISNPQQLQYSPLFQPKAYTSTAEAVMDDLDANNDGNVTREELQARYTALGETLKTTDLQSPEGKALLGQLQFYNDVDKHFQRLANNRGLGDNDPRTMDFTEADQSIQVAEFASLARVDGDSAALSQRDMAFLKAGYPIPSPPATPTEGANQPSPEALMAALDLNSDGNITHQELAYARVNLNMGLNANPALTDLNITPDYINLLQQNFRTIAGSRGGGIITADFKPADASIQLNELQGVGRIDGDTTNVTLQELTDLRNGTAIPAPPTTGGQPPTGQPPVNLFMQLLQQLFNRPPVTGTPVGQPQNQQAGLAVLLLLLALSQGQGQAPRAF